MEKNKEESLRKQLSTIYVGKPNLGFIDENEELMTAIIKIIDSDTTVNWEKLKERYRKEVAIYNPFVGFELKEKFQDPEELFQWFYKNLK